MRKLAFIIFLISFWLIPSNIAAQTSNYQQRTQEIIASFNKKMHLVKEKYGVKKERYREIRSEPVLKQNVIDYAGSYEVPDLGFTLNIEVGSDGRAKGSGVENIRTGTRPQRKFTLKDAQITGALLTAIKIYDDGTSEKFEGVFINRIEFNSPTDAGASSFGLGVIGKRIEFSGVTLDKLFYQGKR